MTSFLAILVSLTLAFALWSPNDFGKWLGQIRRGYDHEVSKKEDAE